VKILFSTQCANYIIVRKFQYDSFDIFELLKSSPTFFTLLLFGTFLSYRSTQMSRYVVSQHILVCLCRK